MAGEPAIDNDGQVAFTPAGEAPVRMGRLFVGRDGTLCRAATQDQSLIVAPEPGSIGLLALIGLHFTGVIVCRRRRT
jgi:hypothetical protein